MPPVEWAESPGELIVRNEDASQFMAQLNQLPLAQRSTLLLHFVEDFSLEEIAEITGAQLGTIKSRIHYGKRALKKLMEETKQ
jgi:RNA polymerase sigma-70 factor (ECF subfamily)